MTVKLLTEHHLDLLSLKGGCTGSSESIHVKVTHCWKSHVTAHFQVHVYNIKTIILFRFYTNFDAIFIPNNVRRHHCQVAQEGRSV